MTAQEDRGYERVKQSAAAHRRSINSEVIPPLTDAMLTAAKSTGRP